MHACGGGVANGLGGEKAAMKVGAGGLRVGKGDKVCERLVREDAEEKDSDGCGCGFGKSARA